MSANGRVRQLQARNVNCATYFRAAARDTVKACDLTTLVHAQVPFVNAFNCWYFIFFSFYSSSIARSSCEDDGRSSTGSNVALSNHIWLHRYARVYVDFLVFVTILWRWLCCCFVVYCGRIWHEQRFDRSCMTWTISTIFGSKLSNRKSTLTFTFQTRHVRMNSLIHISREISFNCIVWI